MLCASIQVQLRTCVVRASVAMLARELFAFASWCCVRACMCVHHDAFACCTHIARVPIGVPVRLCARVSHDPAADGPA
jgi:hypothetical protein